MASSDKMPLWMPLCLKVSRLLRPTPSWTNPPRSYRFRYPVSAPSKECQTIHAEVDLLSPQGSPWWLWFTPCKGECTTSFAWGKFRCKSLWCLSFDPSPGSRRTACKSTSHNLYSHRGVHTNWLYYWKWCCVSHLSWPPNRLCTSLANPGVDSLAVEAHCSTSTSLCSKLFLEFPQLSSTYCKVQQWFMQMPARLDWRSNYMELASISIYQSFSN